jgi:hypothetical protein
MKAFLLSNAGKGTLGVFLTCLILVWPLVASWLVAGLTLCFAGLHFREAFRLLDAELEGAPCPIAPAAIDNVRAAVAATQPCHQPGIR